MSSDRAVFNLSGVLQDRRYYPKLSIQYLNKYRYYVFEIRDTILINSDANGIKTPYIIFFLIIEMY